MGVTVSLRDKGYKAIKSIESNKKKGRNINDIVDEITNYIFENKADLILDIRKGYRKKSELDNEIDKYIKDYNVIVDEIENYKNIIDFVNKSIWGYGATINDLINDLDVSDIAIKGLNDAWIKSNGIREEFDYEFSSLEKLENYAHKVAVKNGARLTRKNALLVIGDDKTSPDFNLRINIGIAPVNSKSPHIVIRKIPKAHIKPNLDLLMERKMMNKMIYDIFVKMINTRCSFLIVGQGGSAKTTLLNALIEVIPEYLSKLCLQEIVEISSNKKNWIWEQVVKKTGDSEVEYPLTGLTENGLRLDLDWFFIGESLGAESMAIFDSNSTGHSIGLTGHAVNTLKAAEKIVLNMKKSGTNYKQEDLLKMFGGNIDFIIFMKKYKVCEITEVDGYNEETGDLNYNPIVKFNVTKETDFHIEGDWERLNDHCDKIKNKFKIYNGDVNYA